MLLHHVLFAYLGSLLVQGATLALGLAPSQLGALEWFSFVYRQHSADVTNRIHTPHLGIYWVLLAMIFRVHSVPFLSDSFVMIPQGLCELRADYKHDNT